MDPQPLSDGHDVNNQNIQKGISSKKLLLITIVLTIFLITVGAYVIFFRNVPDIPKLSQNINTTSHEKYSGKKIFYVDSYHEGYEWSDGITSGIKSALSGTGADLRIFRMDTKRNATEENKLAAALKARDEIAAYKPDVLIVSDDNAFKYVVKEYFKDASLPVVFCGVNWDASSYGAPYTNTTGMVEVSLTMQILDHLRPYAKGGRIGYLSADTETEHKNLEYYGKLFGLVFTKSYFVKNMAGWKDAYLALQKESDVVIFENNAGITDWDEKAAEEFAKNNIRVPVGTTNLWTMKESVLGITKLPEEQGDWSAHTAMKILDGTPPSEIPLVKNERGKLVINLGLADKLNMIFSPSVLKNAQVVK